VPSEAIKTWRGFRSTSENRQVRTLVVASHDAVVTLRTYEASLLSVMCAAMQMFLHTFGKGKTAHHRRRINEAVKVNPLSTIQRPRLSAESLANSAGENCLLKRSEMFANHEVKKQHTSRFPP
jgi:hypothetical protein